MTSKITHIISGGTISHVRNHLALTAPAFGGTGRRLKELCRIRSAEMDVFLHETRMVDHKSRVETPEDVEDLLRKIVVDSRTKIIFLPVAMVDYVGKIGRVDSGKHANRLKSRVPWTSTIMLEARRKYLKQVRENRKDIFLVAFKTTTNADLDGQYLAGLQLLKESSCNLVFANDVVTRMNMVIVPEEARYAVTDDRELALRNLVDIAYLRSGLTFTRSLLVSGETFPLGAPIVPQSLRTVVEYLIQRGAYKPFRGATAGHFAVKVDDTTFLTSQRKTNFNQIHRNGLGLVMVKLDGPDSIIAYGAKPSVGGQSQRIVFKEHPDVDCIVHFHCPKKAGSEVPVRSQREFECGSHQCGQNTSRGLASFGKLKAVFLDEHGPNIVFHRSIDPKIVIDFIEANFDLAGKTGGLIPPGG